jgi:hypothetical protein
MIRTNENTATQVTCTARLLRAAMTFAAKDEMRQFLTGVLVEPHPSGRGVVLVGLDGKRLVALYDKDGTADGWAILPRHPMPADTKANARLMVEFDGERATYYNGDSFSAKFLSGDYPDWRMLLPDACDPIPVAATTAFLADLVPITKAYNVDVGLVHILGGKDGPDGIGARHLVCTFGSSVPAVAILGAVRGIDPARHANGLPDFLQPEPPARLETTDPAVSADDTGAGNVGAAANESAPDAAPVPPETDDDAAGESIAA